jgi:chemotaxis protein MotA
MKVIVRKEEKPEVYIEKIVELANKVRIDGMLALEGEQVQEPTMKFGVQMMVDGVQETEMSSSLMDSITSMSTRHAEATGMYEKAAAYAPAFGMCATVVSLVIMLNGLDFTDATAINRLGASMSAALITTFYGSLMANIIFLPLAARLKLLHKRELFCKTLICNGLMSIMHGTGPKFIREALYEQLNNEMRKKGLKAGQSAGNSGGEQ